MAHLRLLFVGSRKNLQDIYDNAPDSSSETKAEMTIGADWIADYDWMDEEEKDKGWTTDDFTKENERLYKDIINGLFAYCFDIRDPNRYGDFACINCDDYEEYNSNDWRGREERNKKRTIEAIKKLPDDTVFHFAESHW